jgi:plasmid stabilization system protein ParE
MKYKVIIQPPALADIEGAYRYIHERAPSRAPAWLDKLYEAMESLEELPKRCSRA